MHKITRQFGEGLFKAIVDQLEEYRDVAASEGDTAGATFLKRVKARMDEELRKLREDEATEYGPALGIPTGRDYTKSMFGRDMNKVDVGINDTGWEPGRKSDGPRSEPGTGQLFRGPKPERTTLRNDDDCGW
jgi:hypothetical protein